MSSSGLDDALAKARVTLASGLLTNEAGVQASVIRPILRELGWDDADPQQWQVEYQVDNGRVDEALLGSLGNPLVFIEAKKQGNLSVKAEDQLFGYAANKGVPILVLTDGDTWDLYLSMAAGEPAERRFAHLTLTESDDLARVAQDLQEFIAREAVLSGRGDDAAKARLKQVKDREIGKRGLESAWTELLREPDDMLRDLLIERVEQDVGSRPRTLDAEAFLRQQIGAGAGAVTSQTQVDDPPRGTAAPRPRAPAQQKAAPAIKQAPDNAYRMPAAPPPRNRAQGTSIEGFVLRGVTHAASSGSDALVRMVDALASADPAFLEKWAEFNPRGRLKRRRVITSNDDVLRDPDKSRWYTQLRDHGGIWILTNLNNQDKLKEMRRMAELAGLVWERDVTPIYASSSG